MLLISLFPCARQVHPFGFPRTLFLTTTHPLVSTCRISTVVQVLPQSASSFVPSLPGGVGCFFDLPDLTVQLSLVVHKSAFPQHIVLVEGFFKLLLLALQVRSFLWMTAHVQSNWWTTKLNGTCRTWTGRSPQWMILTPRTKKQQNQ